MVQGTKYFLVGLLVAGAVVLGAQARAQQTTGAPTADEVIDTMVATHEGLESYQLSAEVTMKMSIEGQPTQQTAALSLIYAPGPRFAFTTPMSQVYCDGETVIVYVPMANQYQKTEYSAEMWKDSGLASVLGDAMPAGEEGAPQPAAIGAAYRELVEGRKVTGTETAAGHQCWVLEGSASVPAPAISGEAESVSVPVKVWHRKADGLIVKAYGDFTPVVEIIARQAQQGSAPPGFRVPDSMSYMVVAKGLTLNEPIADEVFQFEPPAGAREMSEDAGAAEMGGPGADAQKGLEEFQLSGKPAPDFELESLDGQMIKLSGLAGKVVLLDFWASWCGPCMAELPHIQELWQKLEGKEVLFVGVNLDRNVEDAREAARQKGLTFPSVHDEGGTVANSYGVSGIPCLVIVDAEGKVVGRKVGYDPAVADMLESEILKLLGGG